MEQKIKKIEKNLKPIKFYCPKCKYKRTIKAKTKQELKKIGINFYCEKCETILKT